MFFLAFTFLQLKVYWTVVLKYYSFFSPKIGNGFHLNHLLILLGIFTSNYVTVKRVEQTHEQGSIVQFVAHLIRDPGV